MGRITKGYTIYKYNIGIAGKVNTTLLEYAEKSGGVIEVQGVYPVKSKDYLKNVKLRGQLAIALKPLTEGKHTWAYIIRCSRGFYPEMLKIIKEHGK